MRKLSLLGILWTFALGAGIVSAISAFAAVDINTSQPMTKDKQRIVQDVIRIRVPFIANQGQVSDENVLFYANTFGGTLFVTDKGEMVYAFAGDPEGKKAAGWALRETLVGAAVQKPEGKEPAQTRVNYFIGNDPSKWRKNLPTYNSVTMGEVYPGIELTLKVQGKKIEKIFTIKPGADPSSIRLRLEDGARLTLKEEGELEVDTGSDLSLIHI